MVPVVPRTYHWLWECHQVSVFYDFNYKPSNIIWWQHVWTTSNSYFLHNTSLNHIILRLLFLWAQCSSWHTLCWFSSVMILLITLWHVQYSHPHNVAWFLFSKINILQTQLFELLMWLFHHKSNDKLNNFFRILIDFDNVANITCWASMNQSLYYQPLANTSLHLSVVG